MLFRSLVAAEKFLPRSDLAPTVRSDLQIAQAQTQLLRGDFAGCAASIARHGLEATADRIRYGDQTKVDNWFDENR